MASPSSRTLQQLKKSGIEAGIVERFISQINKRIDLFGFIDLVALYPDAIVGIQCCAGSGHAAHLKKILAEPRAKIWLARGGEIELWSWSKRKVKLKGGGFGKAIRWTPRVDYTTREDFDARTVITKEENPAAPPE